MNNANLLFASDFDGTLAENEQIPLRNRQAIAAFRRHGLFGICSGRDVPSLKAALLREQVEYDFLICMNGAYVEAGGEVLRLKKLRADPEKILQILKRSDCMFHSVIGESEVCQWGNPAYAELLEREGFMEYMRNSLSAFLPRERWQDFEGAILQINCRAADIPRAREIAKRIDAEVAGCHAFANCDFVDIAAGEVSKAEALDFLRTRLGVHEDNVFAIGDSLNDLPMVERFRGFCMEAGDPLLKECASRAFASVADALAFAGMGLDT